MASALKKTTNLTGLAVSKNPHHSLNVLYGKILRVLQKIPPQSAYRKSTEELVKHRSQIINNNADVSAIEKQINCGQVEELIIQAENELVLAKRLVESKAWEPLAVQPPKNQWTWPLTK